MWAAELGTSFNVRNLEAEHWFENYVAEFAQPINDTTREGVQDVIAAGLRDGWSIDTMQNRMGDQFDAWMGQDLPEGAFDWLNARRPQNRLEMIARTETIRASNAGSMELFDRWGYKRKGWLATNDSRTRATHAEAERKYDDGGSLGPIPHGEFFVVGGYNLKYPGDRSGGAPGSETINCRCTVLPFKDKPGDTPAPEVVPTPKPVRKPRPYKPVDFEGDAKKLKDHLKKLGIKHTAYLDRLDADQMNAVGNQLGRLSKRFPKVTKWLDNVVPYDREGMVDLGLNPDTTAAFYRFKRGGGVSFGSRQEGLMSFNPFNFNDGRSYRRPGNKLYWIIADDPRAVGGSMQVTVTHEYGHLLDNFLSENSMEILMDRGQTRMTVARAWSNYKNNYNFGTDGPSLYGRTDEYEIWSESFAEVMHLTPEERSATGNELAGFLDHLESQGVFS